MSNISFDLLEKYCKIQTDTFSKANVNLSAIARITRLEEYEDKPKKNLQINEFKYNKENTQKIPSEECFKKKTRSSSITSSRKNQRRAIVKNYVNDEIIRQEHPRHCNPNFVYNQGRYERPSDRASNNGSNHKSPCISNLSKKSPIAPKIKLSNKFPFNYYNKTPRSQGTDVSRENCQRNYRKSSEEKTQKKSNLLINKLNSIIVGKEKEIMNKPLQSQDTKDTLFVKINEIFTKKYYYNRIFLKKLFITNV